MATREVLEKALANAEIELRKDPKCQPGKPFADDAWKSCFATIGYAAALGQIPTCDDIRGLGLDKLSVAEVREWVLAQAAE